MKKIFTLSLIALLTMMQAEAQDWSIKGKKAWSDGPLVADDFQRLSSKDTSSAGWLQWSYSFNLVNHKAGNLKFQSYDVILYMDQLVSWYDPARTTDCLKYFQTEFDMAEVTRRKLQNEINHNPRRSKDISDYHFRLAENRNMTYMRETDDGRNESEVDRYAEMVANELQTTVVEDMTTPDIDGFKTGIGMYLGYGGELFMGPVGEGVAMGNGVDWGFVFPIHSWNLYWDMTLGGGSRLKKEGFYYDAKEDYNWVKGKPTQTGNMNLLGSYRIIDNSNFALEPMAGIGVGFIDQQIDKEHSKNGTVGSSELAGFRALAGLQLSCKLGRNLDCFTGSYLENRLNFRIYGASTSYKVGQCFSLNFGVTIDFIAGSID